MLGVIRHHILVMSMLAGILTTLLFSICGELAHFHVGLNDFWGVLYYADKMSISEPSSLYNGFFPVGYAALLKVFPNGIEIPAAYILNALFAGLLTTTTIFLAGTSHGRCAAVIAFPVVIFEPLLFRYANTVGPDLGTDNQ